MIDDREGAATARVRASFERQPMMDTLAASLVKVATGEVHIALQDATGTRQQHGYVHGGAIMTVADSAAGYAAMTTVAPDREVLTVEAKANFLRPGRGRLIAKGRVLKSGRTLIVASADVFALAPDGTDGAHIATMLATLAVIEGSAIG